MTKLLVLYPPPLDDAEFDRRYHAEHAPMVREKVPGLRGFAAGRVLGSPMGGATFVRAAELMFDSAEDLQAALASPEGQSVVAHALEISTGGPMTVMIVEEDSWSASADAQGQPQAQL